MALKLPELEPRYYTYIGAACAALGFVFILLAILAILGIAGFWMSALWAHFTALGMLFMGVATWAFHKIGGKKIPV